MGKAEGLQDQWHGHVTAVTVAPEFRRLGLARKMMDSLESVSTELYVNETIITFKEYHIQIMFVDMMDSLWICLFECLIH